MYNPFENFKNSWNAVCNYKIILFILVALLFSCKHQNKIHLQDKKQKNIYNYTYNNNKPVNIFDFLIDTLSYNDVEDIKQEVIRSADTLYIEKHKNYLVWLCYSQWKDTIQVFENFYNEIVVSKMKNKYSVGILNTLKNDSLTFVISINNKIYLKYDKISTYTILNINSFIFNGEKYICFDFIPNGVAGRPILLHSFFKISNNNITKIKDFFSDGFHYNLLKDYNKDKKIDIIYNKEENIDTLCCKKYASISKRLGILTLENDTFIDYQPDRWFIDYCFYSKDTIKLCNIYGFKFK